MANVCLRRSSSFMLVLTALAVAGCGRSAGTDKAKEAPRVTVAHPVVRSLVDEDDYNGWLEASQTVEVRARVRGHIQKVHFKDGDMVKKGQLLFDLDPRPFQAAVERGRGPGQGVGSAEGCRGQERGPREELVKANAVAASELRADRGRRPVLHGPNRGENAGGGEVQARPEIRANHRADRRPDRPGDAHRRQPRQRRRQRSGADDDRGHRSDLRRFQRRRTRDAAVPGDRRRPAKARTSSSRCASRRSPSPSASTRKRGFRTRAISCSPTTSTPRAPARSWSAASPQNPDGRLIPGSRVRVRVPVSDKYEAAVVPDTAVLSDQDRKYLLVLGKDNIVLRRDITPGRLLDDGMRVILPAPGEEKAAGNKDWVKNWEKEWVITVGLQRARIDYPGPAAGRQRPTDRHQGCRAVKQFTNRQRTRSCSLVSSSIGRSSPPCSRW